MAENGHIDLKVQLEGLKKDVENVNTIQSRLDTAIDKLTDVSTSIKSMLAVHEEKLQQQERIDEVIFDKIRERGAEIDEVYKDLHKEIQSIEKRLLIEIKSLKLDISNRVSMLEKYKWLILGGSIVIGFILSSNFKMIVQMFS